MRQGDSFPEIVQKEVDFVKAPYIPVSNHRFGWPCRAVAFTVPYLRRIERRFPKPNPPEIGFKQSPIFYTSANQ